MDAVAGEAEELAHENARLRAVLIAVTETERRRKAVPERLRAGHVLLEAENRRSRHALDRPVRDEHIPPSGGAGTAPD